jgi:CBS domain-containing protein
MKISEAMEKIDSLPYLVAPDSCTLEEIAERITKTRQVRAIYVVDDKERLRGTISLGTLIRHIISARHLPQFHARSILAQITSEKLADIMEEHVIFAKKTSDLKKIIELMANANIKEIPVVDENRCIIANMGILDLWNLYAS